MSQILRPGVDAHTHEETENPQIVPRPERPPPFSGTGDLRAPTVLRPVRPQYRRLALVMAVFDVVGVTVGTGLAVWLTANRTLSPSEFLLHLAVIPPVVGGVFSSFRLYGIHLLSPAEEFRRLVLAVTATVLVLVALPSWATPLSALFSIGAAWTLALILVLVTRRAFHLAVWRRQSRGALVARTLVIGTNEEADRLAVRLTHSGGFLPVGVVATDTTKNQDAEGQLPIVGHLSDLSDVVTRTAADCVFVASTAVSIEDVRFISKVVRKAHADLRLTVKIPEVLSTRLSVQPMDGVIALTLRPVRLTGAQTLAKRLLDIALASTALILAMPLSVAIAIAIKVTSRGPILVRQQRVGRLGAPFNLLKFRTKPWLPSGSTDTASNLRLLTPVGGWLTRWMFDELPQLVNVLKGEMSLVGPRPPLPEEIKRYEDWHFERFEVRPGITGLWQVNARPDLSFDEGVELDLFYIENWSPTYDLYILAKTISAILFGRDRLHIGEEDKATRR
jgi:exopolysaccharide biosynthesis polyprenyl glycosylphosphotransferase